MTELNFVFGGPDIFLLNWIMVTTGYVWWGIVVAFVLFWLVGKVVFKTKLGRKFDRRVQDILADREDSDSPPQFELWFNNTNTKDSYTIDETVKIPRYFG